MLPSGKTTKQLEDPEMVMAQVIYTLIVKVRLIFAPCEFFFCYFVPLGR